MDAEGKNERTLQDDPQYFGGYLNMARLNIFNISNHVADKLSIALLKNEEDINNSFLCNSNQKLNWSKAYAMTMRFMPLLKVFDTERLPEHCTSQKDKEKGKEFGIMCDSLRIVFRELNQFRNDYSHYASTEDNFTRKIEISPELAEFLTCNFKRAIEYTKQRFADTYQDEDFILAERMQMVKSNIITTEGIVFLTSLFLEREHAFLFIGKVKGLKGTQYKQFKATREVFMSYCVNLPQDKLISDDYTQSLIMDIINELTKCPETLYNVLDESARKQFIPQLGEVEADNVRQNSINEAEITDENDYAQYMEDITKRVRHSNRFPYFALRYIDELDLLGKFKFQLDLGKLKLDTYPKSYMGEDVDRTITENVSAFGKLSDHQVKEEVQAKVVKSYSSVQFDQFAPHYNMESNKIGISRKAETATVIKPSKTDVKSSYKLKQPIPEAFLSIKELSKIVLLEYLSPGESQRLITDFISTNSDKLMNLDFIKEVKGKLPVFDKPFYKKVTIKRESYTKDELMELEVRKKLLNQVLVTYGLNTKQIPTRITEYWLDIRDVRNQHIISERIKTMRKDCTTRLKALKKLDETGKGKVPKIGEMASFLARDIVSMVIDPEKKKKITSFYYDKLQASLALFADPDKKKEFIHLVKDELNLLSVGGHPILRNIDFTTIHYTRDLYKKYLEEKGCKIINGKTDISWIFKTFYKKEPGKYSSLPVTKVKLPLDKDGKPDSKQLPQSLYSLGDRKTDNSIEEIEKWLSNVKPGKEKTDCTKPVDLPTNLFDSRLIELLQKETGDTSLAPKLNGLFVTWWERRGDSTQSFYNYKRNYVIYDQEVCFYPNTKKLYQDYYQSALDKAFRLKREERRQEKLLNRRLPDIQLKDIKKIFNITLSETEKEIRILQEEDRLLLLILEKLMEKDIAGTLNLKNVNVLLNEKVNICQQVKTYLSFKENGELASKDERMQITKNIISYGSRKNYGLLRRYVHDRRMPELFEFYPADEIPLEAIKQELEAYNKAKQIVFDKVFELERALTERFKDKVMAHFVNRDGGSRLKGNIQHSPYLNLLESKGVISHDAYRFLKAVRNSFSHNQYPHKKTMEIFVKEWNTSNFANQIVDIYKQKIEEIIENIKK